ncbi:cysteine methyltransferase [Georgenia yuyongxinii]|uniref:Cysteine methyltransferase n=1 Tax=Georgenia yuyongxinii TaxID=2589797 RepID=A0A5B8C244_9MICO|nr:cysteine methyltransferase [Georgenia yuyongxinii]
MLAHRACDHKGVHPDRTELTELVLDVVDQIPAGRVTTYGLVAEAVRAVSGRGHARHVGTIMATYGAEVPWWRVVRADGSLPRQLRERAVAHYREEGTPMSGFVAGRVELHRALWDAPQAWQAPAAASGAGSSDA